MPAIAQQVDKSAGRDAARTRELVLHGAMQEFIAKGFAGARIDAVAERANVNVRSIYQHFDSKATLFRAVLGDSVTHRHEQLVDTMQTLLDEPGRAAELFPAFRLALADNLGWVRLIAWNELNEDLDSGPPEFFSADTRRALYAREIELLDAAREHGTIPASLDSDLLLLAMTGLAAFPSIVRPLTMLITGQDPGAEEFRSRYDEFLAALGRIIADGDRHPGPPADRQSITASPQVHRQLRTAGRALARAGAVGAFGHCSMRLDEDTFLVTAPVPLNALTTQAGVVVPVVGDLPAGVAQEVRLDQSVYRARPDVGAICRLDLVTGVSRGGAPIRPRDRVSAYFGGGPARWDNPSCADTDAVATVLGPAAAISLHGQGSLVAAASLKQAVTLAVFLQQAGASTAGRPPDEPADRLLTEDEVAELATWDDRVAERMWAHLTVQDPEVGGGAQG
jgi:HCOMODA/2-hydroxy-3-carboxy-muconic semialdehyde decarboxylase